MLDAKILKCPDCRANLQQNLLDFVCDFCKRRFISQEGVSEFLPERLDDCKKNEEYYRQGKIKNEMGNSDPQWDLYSREIWRLFLDKKYNIIQFEQDFLEKVKPGRILELGAGSCWASALIKNRYPHSLVLATDISPTYLRGVGRGLASMMKAEIDGYLSCDAESLPFQDEVFDTIFIFDSLHHLPDITKSFNEVFRTLKPGGIFLAVDGACPAFLNKLLFKDDLHQQKEGILDRSLSYSQWKNFLRQSNIPLACLSVYTNPKYNVEEPLFYLGGKILSLLPNKIKKHLVPVGIRVNFEKPYPAGESLGDLRKAVKQANESFYQSREDEREKYKQHPSKLYSFPIILDWLGNYLKANDYVLDDGGGSGILSSALIKKGVNALCFDISEDELLAGQKADPNLKIMVGDSENLPFSDETFDAVVFSASLHHLPNPEQGLKEAKRVLKRGGYLLLQEPNIVNLGALLKVFKNQKIFKAAWRIFMAKLRPQTSSANNQSTFVNGRAVAIGRDLQPLHEQMLTVFYLKKILKQLGLQIKEIKAIKIAASLKEAFKENLNLNDFQTAAKYDKFLSKIPVVRLMGSFVLIAAKKI